MQDSNAVRGEWRKAVVVEPIPSKDGKVRRVLIEYNAGATKTHVERAVQRLILLVPVDQPEAGSVQCHPSIVDKISTTEADAEAGD